MGSAAQKNEASRRAQLETVLSALFAAFAGVTGLVVLLNASNVSTAGGDSWTWWGALLLAVLLATAAGCGFVPAPSRMRRAIPVGATGLAVAVSVSLTHQGQTSDPAPGFVLGVLAFATVMSAHERPLEVYLVFGSGGAAYAGLKAASAGVPGAFTALDDVVLSAAMVFAATNFVTKLFEVADESDRLHKRRRDTELDLALDRSDHEARLQAQHLLHDEVIAVLTSVADGRGDRAATTALAGTIADRLSGDAVATSSASGATIAQLMAQTSATTRLALQVDLADDLLRMSLPEYHWRSLALALSETVRNAERHAGVDVVSITGQLEGSDAVLRVADAGVGFSDPRPGWGVAHSIRRPLEQIGGAASVASGSHAGTVVTLRWPWATSSRPSESHLVRVHAETVSALGGDQRLALQVTLPLLLVHCYLALRYTDLSSDRAAPLALGAATTAATIVLVEQLRSRALSPAAVVFLWACSGTVVWTGLELAGPASTQGYDSWIIGLASVSLTLVAFYLPFGWALGGGAVGAVVVLAYLAQHQLDPARSLGAVNAITTPVVLSWAMGASMRRGVREIDDELTRLVSMADETYRRRLAAVSESALLGQARTETLPFLRSLATGEIDPGSSEVQEVARVLALEARDDLYLAGMVDPVLRRRLRRARAQGVSVEVQASAAGITLTALLTRVIDRLLDHLGPGSSVVVGRSGTKGRPIEILLSPSLDQTAWGDVERGLGGVDFSSESDSLTQSVKIADLHGSPDDTEGPSPV